MGKREESARESRERLLAAAAQCFAEKGHDGCSVADIARRAGMAQGALYVHFRGKEELFAEMLASEHGRGAEKARKVLENGPCLEGILDILSSCIRDPGWPVDHRLWTEMLAVAARNERVRSVFMEGDRAMRAVFTELLRGAAEAGEIDAGLDHEACAVWLYALVDGLIARAADDPDFDIERNITVFRTLVTRTLACGRMREKQ